MDDDTMLFLSHYDAIEDQFVWSSAKRWLNSHLQSTHSRDMWEVMKMGKKLTEKSH